MQVILATIRIIAIMARPPHGDRVWSMRAVLRMADTVMASIAAIHEMIRCGITPTAQISNLGSLLASHVMAGLVPAIRGGTGGGGDGRDHARP
jgi:hypothetical protein